MTGLARADELAPRPLSISRAQLFVAGHEIEIRRQPAHRQIPEQLVEKPRAAGSVEIGVHRIASGDARAVAAREQRDDDALDADAPLVKLELPRAGSR